jgi:hypothetical protein
VRLSWSKEKRGYRVGAGPLGATLKIDGAEVGNVSSLHVGGLSPVHDHGGWYWFCGSNDALGIAYRNTWTMPTADIDTAKAACEAYVRECLGLPEKK